MEHRDQADLADLFAIPDFWKQPQWQTLSLDPKARQEHGFFGLDVTNRRSVGLFAEQEEAKTAEQVGDVFFKIPSGLSLPNPQPETPKENQATQHQPATAAEEASHDELPKEPTEPWPALPEDFWLLPDDSFAPPAPPKIQTWDEFEHPDIPHPPAVLATERGPQFVDALIGAEGNPLGVVSPGYGDVVDAKGYFTCLLALSLGRCSVLFDWDENKNSFFPQLPSSRIPGFTGDVMRRVEQPCLECGNNSRFLRAFVNHTFTNTSQATPSRVALARGVDGLLLVIQRELGIRGHKTQSLLQLQTLIRPVAALTHDIRALVTKLSRLGGEGRGGRGGRGGGVSDEQMASVLFQEAQSMEHSTDVMREVVKHFLQIVSEPWLDFVRAWIGLDPQSKATLWTGELRSKSFVHVGDRTWIDDMGIELAESDYFLDAAKMPAFVPDDMAQALFETGRNLRFLWSNHPDHPLSNMATSFSGLSTPSLQWRFDWESVSAVEQMARVYEQEVSAVIAAAPKQAGRQEGSLNGGQDVGAVVGLVRGGPELDIGWRVPSMELQFFRSTEEPPVHPQQDRHDRLAPTAITDELARVLRARLFGDENHGKKHARRPLMDEFSPNYSLLPLLSFGPIVSAQAHIVNRECMRLLFSAHNIRQHLRLQRDFQLLGNGMFCSRLCHALFDPDLGRAEQKHGIALSSSGLGLRLSDRETWPPASSELRLALMGVLTESYYQDDQARISQSQSHYGEQHRELPGSMSFAVRDLTEEEMDRCMEPDSLEALDFLRLSYKPPSPLLPVLTPEILSKYDCIFRLLLRVLRMYYAVNQLHWKATSRTRKASHRKMHDDDGDDADNNNDNDNDTVSELRFRIEARHFVASVMAYFLDVAVGMAWKRFESWLDRVETDLETKKEELTATPDQLRERHEQTVDEIMSAALLRKRQQPLLQLLQEIFGVILEFAKSHDHTDRDGKAEGKRLDHTRRLYGSFRKKVGVFVTVCRNLGDKESDSMARRDQQQQQQRQQQKQKLQHQEDTAISKLILLLDYNGSYTTSR